MYFYLTVSDRRVDLFRLISLCVLFLLLFAFPGPNAAVAKQPLSKTSSLDTSWRGRTRSVNAAFKPGERMHWRVTYMGLTAGDLRASVAQDSYAGRPVYRLELRARSRGAASWLYTVKDRAVSFMDVRGLFSWGYEYFKNHEDEKDKEKVRYHQDEGFFVRDDGERGDIPRYTQDVLSAVYYLRSQDFTVGDEFAFPVQMGDESATIYLNVSGVEDVKTYDGWKKAYLVKTALEQKNTVEGEEEVTDRVERIKFWLSRGEKKIPYQIAVSAYFGSVYAYLEEYKQAEVTE